MSKLEKLYDRSDAEKWAHPENVPMYTYLTSIQEPVFRDRIYNLDLSAEERTEAAAELAKALGSVTGAPLPEGIVKETFHATGCPEDPDVEVELVVYRPVQEERKALPVVYVVAGGGMAFVSLDAANYWQFAQEFGCIVVCPRYSTVFQGRYPTQVNELHAGYQHIVENAKDLGLKKSDIVLYGGSSGSNLVLSLAHRLKRYGYRPKGCVVECAFVDNRPIFPTSTITSGSNWDATVQWRSSQMYLGLNNVSCFNNPEMYPNYATAEDCIGLCPTFIHGDSEEAHAADIRAYCDKLSQAGVYNELHVWGGSCHGDMMSTMGDTPLAERYRSIVYGNIRDCLQYDLRRLWIEDELA